MATDDKSTTVDAPQGTTVGDAADAISALLAQETGEPAAAAKPKRKEAPARAEAQQSEAEGDAPGEEDDEEVELELDPEDEDTAEEPEDEAPDLDPEKTLIPVMVDGKEERLPLAELTKGYLRQADYTRKTQALAEERRSFTGESEGVRQERLQYAQLLPALARQIQQEMGPEPDWARLQAEDPVAYVVEREARRERQEKIEAARAEYERIREGELAREDDSRRTTLAEEREKLLQAVPAWKDADRLKADRVKIREYGAKLGYSEQQLSEVSDHRAVMVLYKAMKFDEAMSRRVAPQAPKSNAPVARAAPRPVPRPVTDLTRAKQRLAKSGSTRDAAAVIASLL